ncbi:MAG TPA: efflux transporter outer membrane subunit [Vicinamibacterales bacterium]|nr:efflux transporter outer membrane subunit [Vicinamibacterales bacterium]
MRLLVLGLLALSLTACTLRRPYAPPVLEPTALTHGVDSLVVEQRFDPRWWGQFGDPVLDTLMSRALAANHDVRIAVARVDQARALFDDTRLDRYPVATAGVVADRRNETIPGFTDEPRTISTYRAGFDAFWELDVFGRVRNQVRSAAANAEHYAAALDDVRVSVAAEVGRNYFELRGLQQRLAVAERNRSNQEETLRLTRVRDDEGFGEPQDEASAAAHAAAIEASIPPVRNAIAQRAHRLAVLTAAKPGALDVDLAPRPYPVLAKALAIGEPDTLLRRRPDVRAAERRLAAVTANEAIAAADLYPHITISGFLGLLAGRGNLFSVADTRAWAVTPALTWAAFDIGSARARLRGAEGATRESVAAFEQVVLRALEETANALVTYREDQQRLVKLVEQARESSRAAAIARVRYREGAADFLALLDAERTELQAEDAVADAESGVFVSVIAVYKALGGIPDSSSITQGVQP